MIRRLRISRRSLRAMLQAPRRCCRGRGSRFLVPGVLRLDFKRGNEIVLVGRCVARHVASIAQRRAGATASGVTVAAGRRGRTSFAIRRMPFSASSWVEKARAADKDEMAEPADLVVDVHDLLVDGVRVAGAQDAAGDRLLGGDADQAVGRAARAWRRAAAASGSSAPRPRAACGPAEISTSAATA